MLGNEQSKRSANWNGSHVTCLLVHKCDGLNHEFCQRIRDVFVEYNIAIWRDHFRAGQHIKCRVEHSAFHEIDVVVYVFCPESAKSSACKHELRAAKNNGLPVLVILRKGEVPSEYRDRMYLDVRVTSDDLLDPKLRQLAPEVYGRGCLSRTIKGLRRPDADPVELRELALSIACKAHEGIVVEFLGQLASIYDEMTDPVVRFWVATAVSRTGSADAPVILRRFASQERKKHPHEYPLRAITEGLRLLGQPLESLDNNVAPSRNGDSQRTTSLRKKTTLIAVMIGLLALMAAFMMELNSTAQSYYPNTSGFDRGRCRVVTILSTLSACG